MKEKNPEAPQGAAGRGAARVVIGMLAALLGAAAGAQEPAAAPAPRERQSFRIERTAAAIEVDGRLDEEPWQKPATLELVFETNPGDNVPAPVRTEGWLAYDDGSLYVAFKAHDPQPREIRARLNDRDRAFQDDFVGVVLDTFNDQRRAFEFFVNPLGIQMDLLQSDVTGSEDETWDAIWRSAGRVTEEGYVVEMAIPFSSLRFARSTGGEQTWGLDAVRIYPRDQRRRLGLNRLSRDVNCYLCQGAKLTGFSGITPGRNVELTPTLTSGRTDSRSDFPRGELEQGEADHELGLSAKWGITPNLTLNAALNPDFSQVEADAAQLDVNNQFTLFYPEKRPFFLEGADFFGTKLNAVYSRNISDPDWGLKLSGKEGKNALGLIVAQDRVTNLLLPGSQGSALTSLDEDNVSTILRYRRDLSGSSVLGAVYTGREGADYSNRVAGVDGLFLWKDTEAVRIELLGSQTRYPEAIVEGFGQPAGTVSDYALRAVYQHTDRSKMHYFLYQDMGEDFRSDLGFNPQVDFRRAQYMQERYWYNEGARYSRLTLGAQVQATEDQAGEPLNRFAEVWLWGNGPRQSFFNVGLVGGERTFAGVTFDNNYLWFFGEVRPNAWLYLNLDGQVGDEVDFANVRAGESLRLTPAFRFDIGQHLRLNLLHSYKRLEVERGELFTANLSELRATYQFNARTFVRVVSQYFSIERAVELYENPIDADFQDFFNQLLFSYKINPQTVLFLGYSDGYQGDTQVDLTQANRTLFLKLGYAFVL